MCTGIGVYPENHFYSNNFEKEISIIKQKIEAGAEYAVTQMFFDNQKYFDFLEKCRKRKYKNSNNSRYKNSRQA